MKLMGVENESSQEVMELNLQLELLMDRAPSDATGLFILRRDSRGYRGLLKIGSIQRKFVAACKSKTLQGLAKKIVAEGRMQIENWHRSRDVSFSS
jgi:hypothetical protein